MDVRSSCERLQLFVYVCCGLFLLFSFFNLEMGRHQRNIHSFYITYCSQTEMNNQTCLYLKGDQDFFILTSCGTVKLSIQLAHTG